MHAGLPAVVQTYILLLAHTGTAAVSGGGEHRVPK